ncbi:molybdopterin molybdenumtransferase MoeA [Cellulomonas pakistanensis]|uniref:Molybdopterin molybdenumtransferase n=1 Tax=Cellulomonas pakistanensis TaxID=992287 RepID=A0A919P984_9CELL|nr:molybdopterin molybdenumtransferase MoeA [Cellulomonas pakistanensis]
MLDGLRPTPAADLDPAEALGLVLAEPVASRVDVPAFDNAAMDGYALHAADLDGPRDLRVVDDVPAGRVPAAAVAPGHAVRVMTGAPVPEGTAAVVPVERTDGGERRVRVHAPPAPGAHVRRRAEDVAAGAVVLAPGAVVTPPVVGLLHAVGRTAVRVHRRPRVVVLSTGAELAPAGAALAPGRIHDANGPMLLAAAREAGADAVLGPVVPDRPGAVRAALEPHLADADLVVTSAGVSAGAHDVVKADLAGAGVVFTRVAMQPGRPQGCGRLGERGVPVVTLPGNPVSALVSWHLFARPAVRRLLGLPDALGPVRRAVLAAPLVSPPGRRQYVRAVVAPAAEGPPAAHPGSHLLGALARSDGLVVVPEDVTALPEGAVVDVLLVRDDAS